MPVITTAPLEATKALGSPTDTPKTIQTKASGSQLTVDVLKTAVRNSLNHHLQKRQGIKRFYPEEKLSDAIIDTGVKMVQTLCKQEIGEELAIQLCWLVLYDMALLLDNSISMDFDPRKVDVLKETVRLVTAVFHASRGSEGEGIQAIRLLNGKDVLLNAKPKLINGLFKKLTFHGRTQLARGLREKMLANYDAATAKRPLIIIVISDGQLEGERPDLLKEVILKRAARLKKELDDDAAPDAISYQFASVGNLTLEGEKDDGAANLFKALDDDKQLGNYIDCMEYKSLEELKKDNKNKQMRWDALAKLLLGPIDSDYDEVKLYPEINEDDNEATDINLPDRKIEPEEEAPLDVEEDDDDGF